MVNGLPPSPGRTCRNTTGRPRFTAIASAVELRFEIASLTGIGKSALDLQGSSAGQFGASDFSVTQQGQTTPPLDLKLAYQVAVDLTAQAATVGAFNLSGTRQQQPLLTAPRFRGAQAGLQAAEAFITLRRIA